MDFPLTKKVILFDGVCNLCNGAVTRVIRYDKKNTFLFAALSSETGKKIMDHIHIDTNKVDSIILYDPNVSYDIKSTAAIKVMRHFGGLWRLTSLFLLIPAPFRNWVYDFIAKNRYKWFGKKESCMIPTPALKERFLE